MKYASTKAIEKLWGIFKTALSNKVDTTDARLSDNRTPKSHASANTSYGVSSGNVYGHAKASSTVPKMDGTASAGEEVSSFARGTILILPTLQERPQKRLGSFQKSYKAFLTTCKIR